MRRLALALLAALPLVGCGDGPTAPPGQLQVRVRDVHAVTMTVRIVDPATAAEAERLLASRHHRFVTGHLRAGSGGFNQPWSWHLEPSSILFAEVTIEACQTDIRGVEGNLAYWLEYSRTAGRVCVGGVLVGRD